jgi:hypothetical protein
MIVKLTDSDYVNPDDVSNVYVREFGEQPFVKMRDGTEYSVFPRME